MRHSSARVLVVDDDADTRTLMLDILEEDGYIVQSCSNGEQALRLLEEEHFDVVLSDIRMPGLTGIDLLRHVRCRALETEVILMTAYASVETAIQALRREAFDYLIKPFELDELRQRVRHAIQFQSAKQRRHVVEHCGSLSIDHNARRVWTDGREINLPRLQFDLLAYLFARYGQVVPRDELLREIWAYDKSDERGVATLRTAIRRLRQTLNDNAQKPCYIKNIRGVGYQLGPCAGDG